MRAIVSRGYQGNLFRRSCWLGTAGSYFAVALCLALVAVTMPVPLLRACHGADSAACACPCEGTCSCCQEAVPADDQNEPLHGVVRTHGCMACINGHPSVDRVGLVPFVYRGILLDHSPAALVDKPLSGPSEGTVLMVRPQSSLSEVPLYLRVCSFRS